MSDMAASAPAAAVLFKKVRLSVIFMPTSVVYPRMREHAEGFMPLPNTCPAKKQPVILPAPEFHKRIVIQAELLYNPVMKCSLLSRPMTCAHDWISRVVFPGDAVVDATAGNGHDTVFLARLAGPSGQVHAFDVQEEAIRATRERLEKEGLLTPSVRLHLASHDRLAELVRSPVKAIVFNLGYLPGGDKKTVTRTECTLAALEQAAALIAPNGLLSVMCYPGHEGGKGRSGSRGSLPVPPAPSFLARRQIPAPEHRNTGTLPDMRLQAGLTLPPRQRPGKTSGPAFLHPLHHLRQSAGAVRHGIFTSMGSWAKLRSYPSGTNSGS